MSSVKKLTICAVCIALCAVLPPVFHMLALGSILSPMHIPVLLCGLACGWPYGAFCGLAGPVVAHLINGAPAAAMLVSMIPELIVYGLACGLLMKLVRTGNLYADLYCALVPAMLLGRVAGGVARALFLMGSGESYTLAMWAGAYLIQAIPGIILHLILIPALVVLLARAKLIPARYPQRKGEGAAA
ncbi:MAG: ECF transporter S component [Clostridiales bacterium]|nr:ECF transporter S component [Clostridiales bacterium]